MAASISKRQQARNERQLQELIHNVPGNDRCADCAVKNPGWASWNLGIFLCVRCASLHRKLGTHVSKVKSLSMDSWSVEQVENMKNLGNVKSNALYNPKNVRPDIPIDADEVDGAMERFVRQKYETRTLSTNKPAVRQNTGSTGTESWNEEPPPLPPKPKKFPFNLRSASSTTHRQKQQDTRFTPPISPTFTGSDRSDGQSAHKSKPSQLFGMKITGVSNNFDQKLAMLRDMGFGDPRRNSEILKSSNGNLDTAVETLVRLGEGSKSVSNIPTPAPRTLTPVSMNSSGVTGLSIDKTQSSEKKTNNPWEISEDPPQRSASQPALQSSLPQRSQSADPTSNFWNPFLAQPQPSQIPQSLENSFQNLQVSRTGPSQQQQFAQQLPSVPQIPQQYLNNPFHPQQQTQGNPWQTQPQAAHQPYGAQQDGFQPQAFQQQPTGAAQPYQSSTLYTQPSTSQANSPSNPWAPQQVQSPPPTMQPANPWMTQMPSAGPAVQQSANLFGPQPSAASWQPQSIFQQPATTSPAPMPEYFPQQQQAQPAQQLGQTPWQQQQQVPLHQTGQYQQQQQSQYPSQFSQIPPPTQPTRHDKNSILALYNIPQSVPRQPLQTLQEDPNAQPAQLFPQRSATMPVQQSMGSANPWLHGIPPSTQPIRHVSNESVDFIGMGAGARHSPDAFAGLSAQYRR